MEELNKEPNQRKIFSDDIILTRNDSPEVNIPHDIVYHSPDGFEWGYGGSGPSELALNILYQFLDFPRAYLLHQDFKWEFISKAPKEGTVIKKEKINKWIDERL